MMVRRKNHLGVPAAPSRRLLGDVVAGKVLDALELAERALSSAGIPYWIVGGLAVGAWGHPRATKDVDFLVRREDAFELKGGGLVTFRPGVPIEVKGVAVDYLTTDSARLAPEEFPGTRSAPPASDQAVAPLEVVFLLKLQAHRAQDRADLIALIKKGADLGPIRKWLRRHQAPDELTLLDTLEREAREEEAEE